jgi:hypothetical protein
VGKELNIGFESGYNHLIRPCQDELLGRTFSGRRKESVSGSSGLHCQQAAHPKIGGINSLIWQMQLAKKLDGKGAARGMRAGDAGIQKNWLYPLFNFLVV